jgi:hypothetical protein
MAIAVRNYLQYTESQLVQVWPAVCVHGTPDRVDAAYCQSARGRVLVCERFDHVCTVGREYGVRGDCAIRTYALFGVPYPASHTYSVAVYSSAVQRR